MELESKIYVAGHRGMVGSAIIRALGRRGFKNIVVRTHAELDLRDQAATNAFFEAERPDYVFLAASKVGGIAANAAAPADFLYDNAMLEMNAIHAAWKNGCRRLLFL
ncbi:MAG: NAD-dependent epimerase/dehydratase family protein, partial [Kiritimatiellae bacterium]|nr:NAD-dependent epimerase/dehydratase family protein [Kiritimatiellia bacterium]